MRSLAIAGALILATGIALIVYDMTNPEQICRTTIAGWENCKEHVSNRGGWIVGLAVIWLAGTFGMWTILTPRRLSQ